MLHPVSLFSPLWISLSDPSVFSSFSDIKEYSRSFDLILICSQLLHRPWLEASERDLWVDVSFHSFLLSPLVCWDLHMGVGGRGSTVFLWALLVVCRFPTLGKKEYRGFSLRLCTGDPCPFHLQLLVKTGHWPFPTGHGAKKCVVLVAQGGVESWDHWGTLQISITGHLCGKLVLGKSVECLR